ncbi:MAG: LamG-like jellyroll fold domain-containing protein, partial [Planctomycetaceae bacterium]
DADLRHEAVRVAATACPEAEFRRLAAPLVDDPSPRVRAALGDAATPLLEKLTADPAADLRHEAIRVAATVCSEADFRRLAAPLVDDPSPRVRAALGDALRRIPVTSPDTVALLVRFGCGPAQGDPWTVYARDFERYLARWAMEKHAAAVAAFLASPAARDLPAENRLLATLAPLDPRACAAALARLLPDLGRAPQSEEIRLLASQAAVPEVAAILERYVRDPRSRAAAIAAVLKHRTAIDSSAFAPIMSQAATDLLAVGTPADRTLGLEVAGAFKLKALAPQVSTLLADAAAPADLKRAALRCLRELGAMSGDTGRAVLAAAAGDRQMRAEVLGAWAESRDAAACRGLLAAWDDLGFAERQAAAAALARHREGAAALVAAMAADDLEPASLPITVVADMRAVLGTDPALERIWTDLTSGAPAVLRLTGGDADAAATVSLDGPFTVEAWVNLDAPIGNQDSLLAADGVCDMNFHGGQFRIWTKPLGDILVAKATTAPGTWMHYAVTRDADGVLTLYVNGELDTVGRVRDTTAYGGLRIGHSTSQGAGTQGRIAEFRVWKQPRTADEIRADFDRSYAGDGARPPSLVSFHGGVARGDLAGKARIEPALDAPKLVTQADAAARAEKFARFRALAEKPGDAARGQALFTTRCLTCHQQGGQGGKIGPTLDGVGLTGVEAILRNVLTPNAAMEGGYRNFRVVTRDGRVVQGLLVSQDADAIVIRQPDAADIRVAAADVSQAGFTGISIMPEGLLESLQPEEVSDLFAHLESLQAAPAKR